MSSEGFATKCIHAGNEPEKWPGKISLSLVPPIVMSTTFKQLDPVADPCEDVPFVYTRDMNPTRKVLEECLAPLEKAKHALTFSTGLGAVTTLIFLLENGNHILYVDNLYEGTRKIFKEYAARMGIQSSPVDMLDLKRTEEEMRSNTTLIWIESPTNPTLKLIDIEAITTLARKKCPKAIVAVDNTFASSYFQNPIDFGVDIVMHSLTKYMNGHSDVCMGAIMTNRDDLYERVHLLQYSLGIVPSPFDCSQVNRSLKTLSIRMREHMSNALRVAQALEENTACVEKVIYPGLKSHPQHELYKKQMRGFGGMLALYVKGGLKETRKFVKELKIFAIAESLGGFESIVKLPAIMGYGSMAKEEREAIGIMDNLVRVSVGLEDANDLIQDLEQALVKAVLAE